VLLALCLPLTACGPEEGGTERLILANVHAEGYPTARALGDFADSVAADPALSGVSVELQLGGVLGNEKETLEKLGFGGVAMVATSAAPLTEFSSTIGVLTLPYLFRDAEHMWRVLDGEIGDELLASLEANGMVGLAWYDAGARSFYNRERPIRRLEDLRGLKIRVQKSEIMRRMVASLGATPVSLGFKEVYTNLYTGAVDGAENNLPSYLSERHFEVAKHYSYDRHSMIPDLLVIGRGAWDELTDGEREALRRAARESSAVQRRYWREYVDQALEAVEAAGCEVSEVADLEPFRRAVESIYEETAGRYGELVALIRAVGEPEAEAAAEAAAGAGGGL